ncbi:MAG: hypothetical protein ACK5Z5_09820 [Neisseriaceae bacterium]
MLLAGLTQKEIGDLLGFSRTYILKIIAEGLCIKFNLNMVSTKSLIEKAIALEYTRFIPERLQETFNKEMVNFSIVDIKSAINSEITEEKHADINLKLFSHRDIIETYFKSNNSNNYMIEVANNAIKLNEQEEVVLFMLLAGLTQKEIGDLLGFSRSYILKIIAESLCVKFKLSMLSTKSLIEKAVALGYARLIPAKFLRVFDFN